MKQLEVQILGQSYLLGCPEGGESRLLDAVEKVDTAMCRIRDAGKVKARDRIAVLAALNLAFDLGESAASNESLQAAAISAALTPVKPPTTSFPPGTAADSDARLAMLIGQLDNALGEDGRLL